MDSLSVEPFFFACTYHVTRRSSHSRQYVKTICTGLHVVGDFFSQTKIKDFDVIALFKNPKQSAIA